MNVLAAASVKKFPVLSLSKANTKFIVAMESTICSLPDRTGALISTLIMLEPPLLSRTSAPSIAKNVNEPCNSIFVTYRSVKSLPFGQRIILSEVASRCLFLDIEASAASMSSELL